MTQETLDHLTGIKGYYYFQCKFFEEQEDFWKYVKEWPHQEMNQETCERLLKTFSKNIVMNIFLFDRGIKNGRMMEILEKLTMEFCKEITKE
jgi:hypothetical protein